MTSSIPNPFSSTEIMQNQSSVPSCQQKNNTSNQPTSGNKREKKTESFPFGKCRICHDTATGVHYGVITCEGCKGFFKRTIMQGVPYHCFFGAKCKINIETRNRCKACRFNRCLEQGMSIENVKMGRIPKKLKEKALHEHQKRQQANAEIEKQAEENQDITIESDYDDDNDCQSSHEIIESTSSSSTSNSFNTNTQETTPEIIVIPNDISHFSKEPFRTVDLIELTISSSDHLSHNLSLLRLPPIFRTSSETCTTPPIKSHEDQSTCNLSNNETMTVSKYISNMNESTLIDYMFSWELRYSKNVLQIMRYLSPKLCQPFLVYELDFELTSFFRYIRWKMLNFYFKHTTRVRPLIKRMFGIIDLGVTNYPGMNATCEQMFQGVQAGISVHVNELLGFAQDTPGLNELNMTDFRRILNNRVFDFWIILNYPLFYKNETYIMTPTGLQYTRYFMNKFIGQTTTNALHEFSERLHALNITQVEHSLIFPIVICRPDPQLQDSENVHIIKQCYMYALYIQLCTTRTEDEANILFNNILEMLDSISHLDELCKKNIGEIVLDKSMAHK